MQCVLSMVTRECMEGVFGAFLTLVRVKKLRIRGCGRLTEGLLYRLAGRDIVGYDLECV